MIDSGNKPSRAKLNIQCQAISVTKKKSVALSVRTLHVPVKNILQFKFSEK